MLILALDVWKRGKMEAVSCGGIVIYRDKVLLLYKNIIRKYDGWVLPKGTMECGETYNMTALREVKEEAGINAKIQSYLGKTNYTFKVGNKNIDKTVHWFLMSANSYYSNPQAEEFFTDSGYYKYNEAKFLLRYENEAAMIKRGFDRYHYLKSINKWPKGR